MRRHALLFLSWTAALIFSVAGMHPTHRGGARPQDTEYALPLEYDRTEYDLDEDALDEDDESSVSSVSDSD